MGNPGYLDIRLSEDEEAEVRQKVEAADIHWVFGSRIIWWGIWTSTLRGCRSERYAIHQGQSIRLSFGGEEIRCGQLGNLGMNQSYDTPSSPSNSLTPHASLGLLNLFTHLFSMS